MALSRINSLDILNALNRVSRTVSTNLEIQCTTTAAVHRQQHLMHLTSQRYYPDPPMLALPNNVRDISANETGRFGPERARDIALYSENGGIFTEKRTGFPKICDKHVDSYDCFGAVSLNSTMQSNVPQPYSSHGMSMHLNMPGGQRSRDNKYIAEDMQRVHYRQLSRTLINAFLMSPLVRATYRSTRMSYSTDASKVPKNSAKDQTIVKPIATMSQRDKFRLMLKHYGGTLIFVHINISLMCLGTCYTIIASGVDVTPFLTMVMGNLEHMENLMKTSTDFILAYTIHKLLAPVRISLSLAITPIFVRRLRLYGLLKTPKVKPQSQL